MGHGLTPPPIVITGAGGALAQEVITLLGREHSLLGITRQAARNTLQAAPGVAYRGWDFLEEPGPHTVQAVVHLAAHVDFSASLETVVACTQANVLRTTEVVSFCRRWQVPRLVFASTVSVYRSDAPTPIAEESPVGPSSAYAASKWMGELAVQAAGGEGMTWAILRFAGIYGQRDRRDPVLNRFVQQALRGETIRVLSPEVRRDYLYLKDAARAVALATQCPAEGVFNIASGQGIALGEMARQVCRILGGRYEVSEGGSSPSPLELVYDVSKARAHLNFACRYNLVEGLQDIRGQAIPS